MEHFESTRARQLLFAERGEHPIAAPFGLHLLAFPGMIIVGGLVLGSPTHEMFWACLLISLSLVAALLVILFPVKIEISEAHVALHSRLLCLWSVSHSAIDGIFVVPRRSDVLLRLVSVPPREIRVAPRSELGVALAVAVAEKRNHVAAHNKESAKITRHL